MAGLSKRLSIWQETAFGITFERDGSESGEDRGPNKKNDTNKKDK